MNEEEKGLYSEIIKTREEQNKNFKTFMKYSIGFFGALLLAFSLLIGVMIVSYSNTICQMEEKHTEAMNASQQTIQELWKCYFETDYEYGGQP